MNKLSAIKNIFIWLSGFDNQTAANCTSSEQRKICIAGSMVLLPGLIGLFSYGYAMFFIFKSPIIAIIGGLMSAMVLITIDRTIVSYSRSGKFSVGMLGRLFIACTCGLLLAEPIILKIFDDCINEQVQVNFEVQKKVNSPKYESEIDRLRSELTNDKFKLDAMQNKYNEEADGTGGSGNKNLGPIFKRKYQDYCEAKADYDKKSVQIKRAIDSVKAQEQKDFQKIDNNQNIGLINRMRALNQVATKEPVVNITSWLLRLFFIFIELLPILIKITPTGDKGLYHSLVDLGDEEKIDIYKMSSGERKEVKKQREIVAYKQEKLKLCQFETEQILSAKQKDTLLLMEAAFSIVVEKISIIEKASKIIKDNAKCESFYATLNNIEAGFILTVNELLKKSNLDFETIEGKL